MSFDIPGESIVGVVTYLLPKPFTLAATVARLLMPLAELLFHPHALDRTMVCNVVRFIVRIFVSIFVLALVHVIIRVLIRAVIVALVHVLIRDLVRDLIPSLVRHKGCKSRSIVRHCGVSKRVREDEPALLGRNTGAKF